MDQPQGSVTIAHTFGTIEAPAEAVMHFVSPMWGFDGHTDFALLPAARQGLWWFISTGDTPTTFVLADPFMAQSDYSIDLNETERDELHLQSESDALALVMLAMPAMAGEAVTANFRAPLVFNVSDRRVKQVVNRDDRYAVAQPIDLSVYPAQENGLQIG